MTAIVFAVPTVKTDFVICCYVDDMKASVAGATPKHISLIGRNIIDVNRSPPRDPRRSGSMNYILNTLNNSVSQSVQYSDHLLRVSRIDIIIFTQSCKLIMF